MVAAAGWLRLPAGWQAGKHCAGATALPSVWQGGTLPCWRGTFGPAPSICTLGEPHVCTARLIIPCRAGPCCSIGAAKAFPRQRAITRMGASPEFYNTMMERPAEDPRGYDVLVVNVRAALRHAVPMLCCAVLCGVLLCCVDVCAACPAHCAWSGG